MDKLRLKATALSLAADLSELAGYYTANISSDGADLLEAMQDTVEDLQDMAAKYGMKLDELRYARRVERAKKIALDTGEIERLGDNYNV